MSLASILKVLIHVFYPLRCIECKSEIENGILCSKCRSRYEDFRCYKFNEFADGLDGVCTVYRYEGAIKKVFHKLKYWKKSFLLGPMSEEIISDFDNIPGAWDFKRYIGNNKYVVVTPIPTDMARRKNRGYDIPERIFKPWSKKFKYNWQETLLRKRNTKPQFGMDQEERIKNVSDCFSVKARLDGKTIVLVDDIFTTGSTMREAARVLKLNGAKRVIAFTYASEASLR